MLIHSRGCFSPRISLPSLAVMTKKKKIGKDSVGIKTGFLFCCVLVDAIEGIFLVRKNSPEMFVIKLRDSFFFFLPFLPFFHGEMFMHIEVWGNFFNRDLCVLLSPSEVHLGVELEKVRWQMFLDSWRNIMTVRKPYQKIIKKTSRSKTIYVFTSFRLGKRKGNFCLRWLLL